jgi:fatty acid desaturase
MRSLYHIAMIQRKRDYRLTGPESALAAKRGHHLIRWYAPPLPRKRLAELMERRDGPAIRDTLLWFVLLGLSGAGLVAAWPTPWCIPFAIAYGLLYGTASDSRWHECGHGRAFKTKWMNDAVYQIACFMILREPIVWRRSHARHHTNTLIVGWDPEIALERPPSLFGIFLNLFAIRSGTHAFASMVRHAAGRMAADEATFIPKADWPSVFRTARIWLCIYAVVAATCVVSRSVLPAMLVGLPSFYGAWLQVIFGMAQHGGLAEDVEDHRLNSRTVRMNPVFRFLYWNMNFHLEHHMFPMVPYHALPELHREIAGDCPPPARSLLHAYREIVPALLAQRRDPTHQIDRVRAGLRPANNQGA